MRMKKYYFSFLSCFLLFSFSLYAQDQRTITGKVTSANGDALAGVSITNKATGKGTQTNVEGGYSIEAATGNTLVFSFVGFQEQSLTVKTGNTLNLTLFPAGSQLDSVTVVAM